MKDTIEELRRLVSVLVQAGQNDAARIVADRADELDAAETAAIERWRTQLT